ncbi:hypothetical protein L208DRAFT_1395561 [Tricholoma matsutake]|nr:hypothetical protein L208DRAFT_1395561 [Tricholoma matsutake 945]
MPAIKSTPCRQSSMHSFGSISTLVTEHGPHIQFPVNLSLEADAHPCIVCHTSSRPTRKDHSQAGREVSDD